jgi:hypothetical protein
MNFLWFTMQFQRFTRFKTKRSKRHYSYESQSSQLGPCVSSKCCMKSLTRIKLGRSSEACGADRRGLADDGWRAREHQGTHAHPRRDSAQPELARGRLPARTRPWRPQHQRQRSTTTKSCRGGVRRGRRDVGKVVLPSVWVERGRRQGNAAAAWSLAGSHGGGMQRRRSGGRWLGRAYAW